MRLKPNEQLGPYTLIRKLGTGGQGTVWLAGKRDGNQVLKVAIKIPLENVNVNAALREAMMAARAYGDPKIAEIKETGIYDDLLVIEMDYFPDGSLKDWLQKKGGPACSVDKVVAITRGILSGLEHLHGLHPNPIIHRDLKPGNVLMQGDTPYLTDFGIARLVLGSRDYSRWGGTMQYMAPEALDGERSRQTDLWSVGVMLYEMLTGSLPFPQEDEDRLVQAIRSSEPPALPVNNPAREVVRKALQKKLGDRYATAGEMSAALGAAMRPDPPRQPAPVRQASPLRTPAPADHGPQLPHGLQPNIARNAPKQVRHRPQSSARPVHVSRKPWVIWGTSVVGVALVIAFGINNAVRSAHGAASATTSAQLQKTAKLRKDLEEAQGVSADYQKADALRTVAEAWIETDPNKAQEVWQQALQVVEGMQDRFWKESRMRDLIVTEAKIKPEKALELVKRLKESEQKYVLPEVAAGFAKFDPRKADRLFQQAIDITEGLEKDQYRVGRLCDIAEKWAISNPQKAKDTLQQAYQSTLTIKEQYDRDDALKYTAAGWANIDSAKAFDMVTHISSDSKKADTLEAIVGALERVSQQRALQATDTLQDKWTKATALTKIGRDLKYGTDWAKYHNADTKKAQEMFQQAFRVSKGIQQEDRRDGILSSIASYWVDMDPKSTLEVAERIQGLALKTNALRKVASAYIRTDREKARSILLEALQVSNGMAKAEDRDDARSRLAEVWAEIDPQTAYDLVQTVKKPDWRTNWAIRAIVSSWAETNPRKALQITKTIKDWNHSEHLLPKIAASFAKRDPQQAKDAFPQILQVALHIDNHEGDQVAALTGIVTAYTNVDLRLALRAAEGIVYADYRAKALREVAVAWRKTDPGKADSVLQEALRAELLDTHK